MFYYRETSFFLSLLTLRNEKIGGGGGLCIYLKRSGSHKNYKSMSKVLKLQNSEYTSYKYTKIAFSHLSISK